MLAYLIAAIPAAFIMGIDWDDMFKDWRSVTVVVLFYLAALGFLRILGV